MTAEGLLDLTGEGAESFSFDDPRFVRLIESGQIEDIMKRWAKSRFLMGVSRTTDAKTGVEQDTGMGILAGHAYSVLDVKVRACQASRVWLCANVLRSRPSAAEPDCGQGLSRSHRQQGNIGCGVWLLCCSH